MPHLLDTNIVSYLFWPQPPRGLHEWMAAIPGEDMFISALTVGEIQNGILEMPMGRRRSEIHAWFTGPKGPQASFANRILAFDEQAALIWARLMADGKVVGKPRNDRDMIIAATAEANGCTIVTNNEKDFIGLDFINPVSHGVREPAPCYRVAQPDRQDDLPKPDNIVDCFLQSPLVGSGIKIERARHFRGRKLDLFPPDDD